MLDLKLLIVCSSQDNAAYRFMCASDNLICESRNTEFFENVFPFKKSICGAASSSHSTFDPVCLLLLL